jgi:O-antigen/teichoic acid export membrane protein
VKVLLVKLGIGSLGVAATAISVAMFLRGGILALYLVAITRWLGVDNYGTFASAVTAAAILAPVAGWGAAQLLMQRISARPHLLGAELKSAAWQLTFVGSALVAISLIIAWKLNVQMNLAALIVVSVSELLLLPATLLVATACQAVGDTRRTMIVICLSPILRLLSLGVAAAAGANGSPANAALVHLVGTLLATVISLRITEPVWRKNSSSSRAHNRFARLVRGTRYALGNAAALLYLEIDKLLIISLVGSNALGSYVVAFRIAMLAGTPVAGLSSVVLPRLFSLRGSGQRVKTERVALLVSTGYGALAGAALALASPWLTLIFGQDFGDASRYLLLLSPWPMLYACKLALATQLTGAGQQGLRAIVESGGVMVALLAGWPLIASYGAKGAALALLVAEASMIVVMLLLRILGYRGRE